MLTRARRTVRPFCIEATHTDDPSARLIAPRPPARGPRDEGDATHALEQTTIRTRPRATAPQCPVHHDEGDGSTTTTTRTDDARRGYVRRLGGAHSPRRVHHGGARGRVKGTGGRRPSRRRVDAVPAAPGQAGPARGPPPRGSARGGTAARALSLSAPVPSPNRRRGRCDPPRMRRRVSERRGGAAPRQAGLSRGFWIRRRGRCIERPCGRVLPPADAGARRDASGTQRTGPSVSRGDPQRPVRAPHLYGSSWAAFPATVPHKDRLVATRQTLAGTQTLWSSTFHAGRRLSVALAAGWSRSGPLMHLRSVRVRIRLLTLGTYCMSFCIKPSAKQRVCDAHSVLVHWPYYHWFSPNLDRV